MKTMDFLPDAISPDSAGKSKRKPYVKPDVEIKTKIAALSATGMSFRKIAGQVGVSDKTVANVLKEPAVAADVQEFEKRFARKLDDTAEKILDRISDTDIERAGLRDKCVSIGVLTDKSRLVKGKSTSNQSILFSIVEAACRSRAEEGRLDESRAVIDVTPTENSAEE